MNHDSTIYFGGSVKALGNGKIEGYGILYSGVADPDLEGEFFTKGTDLMLEVGDRRPLLYRHGVHPAMKARRTGPAQVSKIDDTGVFFEAELDLSDKYWRAVYKLAEMGKLGFSTGSMNHLVEKSLKTEGGKKATEILTWPVGELSLTPSAVEPRTCAMPVKSLEVGEDLELEDAIKSFEEEDAHSDFDIAGTPALKTFCEDMAPNSLKNASQRSESAERAVKEFITTGHILGEAIHAYTTLLVRRTENRFLKENRPLGSSHVMEVESLLSEVGKIEPALTTLKESLLGIKKISDLTKAEQKAMNEKSKLALWNYYRVSGTEPKELDNGSQHV